MTVGIGIISAYMDSLSSLSLKLDNTVAGKTVLLAIDLYLE